MVVILTIIREAHIRSQDTYMVIAGSVVVPPAHRVYESSWVDRPDQIRQLDFGVAFAVFLAPTFVIDDLNHINMERERCVYGDHAYPGENAGIILQLLDH
jgi:hypothetical protein